MEKEFTAGQEQIIEALVYGVIFLVLVTTGLILFFHYSRKKILRKELEKKAVELAYQQRILQAAITTQEEERTRIAQDLHDAISARLNVISLTVHTLLDDPDIHQKQKTALQHILEVATGTLDSSRKIAHDLMPPVLDKFGLKAALQELFEDFTKSTSVQIHYEIEKWPYLSKTNELHIFRIVQELINNSVRHGKANRLVIRTKEASGGFSIHYHDNGAGFKIDDKKTGIGLQNIKSRVGILKGKLHMESSPETGSTFIIHLPS